MREVKSVGCKKKDYFYLVSEKKRKQIVRDAYLIIT